MNQFDIAYIYNRTLLVSIYYINRASDNVKSINIANVSTLLMLYSHLKDSNFKYSVISDLVTKRELQRLIQTNHVIKAEYNKGYYINKDILNCLQKQCDVITDRFNKPKYKAFLNK